MSDQENRHRRRRGYRSKNLKREIAWWTTILCPLVMALATLIHAWKR